jgi:hypothetical protein
MNETQIIYIPLLDEGVSVWRPTKGINLGNDTYKVVATENYNPKIEEWKFPPNSIVECTLELWKNEKILVAKKLVKIS